MKRTAESAASLVYNVYTCEIGQLRAKVQAPVSGNEACVEGWGRPAVPVVSVVRK